MGFIINQKIKICMKQNLFNSIKLSAPGKNVFDLSHDVKLSCNMGQLVPITCIPTVPGDKFNIGCESMVRFAPMVAPIMHRVDITMHYWFVPKRILWSGWEKFITQNIKDGLPLPAHPYVRLGAAAASPTRAYTKLCDYMGIPIPIGSETEDVNMLPFAAYYKTWYDNYRDQNQQDQFLPLEQLLVDGINDGANADELLTLRNRCWEHDYFTSALPTAQQGAEVSIPLGQVTLDPDWANNGSVPNIEFMDGTHPLGTPNVTTASIPQPLIQTSGDPTKYAAIDPDGSLIVEATTINDLRRATRLQEWLEKAMRAGARYAENILAFFNVRSSDQRLQRPEYITGTKTPVQISEVLNTTGTDNAPQGQMAGHGIGVVGGEKYGDYFCEEHGYILGLMSVMPKTAYQQGIPKHFLKFTDAFEEYWPQFANIGEQEVLNKEVYAFQGAPGIETFGYVPRYSEYKFENNRVAGDFRTTLDFWHMGRKFATPPNLNDEFIESDPTHRIFAVTDPDEDKLWIHVYNKIRAIRPMPKYGTPTF